MYITYSGHIQHQYLPLPLSTVIHPITIQTSCLLLGFVVALDNFLSPVSTFYMCMDVAQTAGSLATFRQSCPQKRVTLPSSAIFNCQQFPVKHGAQGPFPIHSGILTGFILCRSCVDKYNCHELMCATVLSWPEVNIPQLFSSLPNSHVPTTHLQWSLVLDGGD